MHVCHGAFHNTRKTSKQAGCRSCREAQSEFPERVKAMSKERNASRAMPSKKVVEVEAEPAFGTDGGARERITSAEMSRARTASSLFERKTAAQRRVMRARIAL
ncbi:hypothetical protein Bphy_7553 (plasmid) [Paraburkholderia phymatum STM815]|uniref:Uncharacterized protein n=1 Tax=Paraburkholderia phymatum (strain DSM 17167 / CIP 108236 / LMG 21445 / STM815) TaxID=391038 RepID=B2JXX9_PARP8|nr:hypothetical protein Bphy_7553 [Paraburkholderia phymatum STM815]